MSYVKTKWVDGQTPLNAKNLNNLENGVEKANELADLAYNENLITFDPYDFNVEDISETKKLEILFNKNIGAGPEDAYTISSFNGRIAILKYFPITAIPTIKVNIQGQNPTNAIRYYENIDVGQGSDYGIFKEGVTKYFRFSLVFGSTPLNEDVKRNILNGTVTVNNVEYELAEQGTSQVITQRRVSLKESGNQDFGFQNLHFMSVFEKAVFIGDSLTAGFTNYDTVNNMSSQQSRELGRNWPTYMSLRNGRKDGWTNLGYGSTTTHSWRYNDDSLGADINNATKLTDTQLYVVALGFNDRSKVTVGSIDDIKTDYNTNADTFYGNLNWILNTLLKVNSGVKIFVLTMPDIPGKITIDQKYNTAIKNVVNNLSSTNRVHLIDLAGNYASYYSADIISKTFNGHGFPMSYNYMSLIIEKAFNDYILNNYDYFKSLPL